ncbi:MAG: hypothetical protein Q4D57_05380 [Clostridia bacterium]|nr:hypothetical protein [Clostridia bacterium]
MINNEEKIKAFFDDEEKVKALANDKEFIESVAGGTATAETYRNEFQKLGLSLTPEEAEQVAKDTKKVLSMPAEKIEKIGEDSLADISGGMSNKTKLQILSASLGVSSLALGIGSIINDATGHSKEAAVGGALAAATGAGGVVALIFADKSET